MQESVELFRRAAHLMPDNAEFQYWLGRTLIKLGHPAEGEKILLEVQESHNRKRKVAREDLNRGMSSVAPSAKNIPPQ